jgi:hypothetical protein
VPRKGRVPRLGRGRQCPHHLDAGREGAADGGMPVSWAKVAPQATSEVAWAGRLQLKRPGEKPFPVLAFGK